MLPMNYSHKNHIFNTLYQKNFVLTYLQGLICNKIQPTTEPSILLFVVVVDCFTCLF